MKETCKDLRVLHLRTVGLIGVPNPELGQTFRVKTVRTIQTNKHNQPHSERVKGELCDLFPDCVCSGNFKSLKP